jgi:hypothetical protein
MKKAILSFVHVLIIYSAGAQFVVTGKIMDSATREPLSPASVYCQNTTLGTVTSKDGEFSIALKSGGYDLVFSFTGYQTQTVRVKENSHLEILMIKEDKSMSEVVLKTSNEVADGWEKYGDFFVKNFIGTTPNSQHAVLENPEVLKFYFSKRNNKLKVLATEAVRISNKALGYNLTYQLDSFVYHYNNHMNSYRGYCFFAEMEGDDSTNAAWAKARLEAYEGSKLHFLRSYYDSSLKEDGWIVDLLDEKNDKKFGKIDPYDSAYYGAMDSTMQIEIWFPRKISVTYKKKSMEYDYLKKMNLPKNIPYIISYVDLRDAIAITENGWYYDQKDWVNQGYWSWKNLADLLPYDYVPPVPEDE